MIRKAFSIVALFLCAIFASAQNAPEGMPQMQNPPMPEMPGLKSGKLPNGLSYYILHNEEPKERANFYIAQKVGSTLETPTQLGLAHFLEHMAFNGTSHYPGKAMLNYLESKGIRFGNDINAYTYYDETVYNINNVNTKDMALMDSVLLAIYDWSGSILLEDAEIDAERGVIEEEWRFRNDANFRMLEAVLPVIYNEYQYQQSVIGKMDIIRNFPYSEIKEYYKKWYRPDQQGIVIVGDFDAAEMEKKVIELFSTIPMPENAAPRTYPSVSDNTKPIFAYFDDPETRFPRVDLAFKYDKIPYEARNTVMAFMQENIVEDLITEMINNRLDEYAQKPECKYLQAGAYFGDFWVSKTKGAFNVVAIGKDNAEEAINDALAIVARACKTGFTVTELERASSELLSQYEKKYNERGKTDSDIFGKILYRHFIDNKPAAGPEIDYQLIQQALPMINVQQLNEMASQLLTPENQVIVVSRPRKEGMSVITEEQFVGNIENILNAQYEAYQDEVITDPLIANLRDAGKVVSQKDGDFGTTELILSNGVKVVVKPTDFKADEITLQAFAPGGKQSYSASEANLVLFAGDAVEASKLGNFTRTTLKKFLAGKQVGVRYDINNATNQVSGQSTVKDLETMLQMVYATFTELSADNDQFAIDMAQIKNLLASLETNPNFIFQKHESAVLHNNNPMFKVASIQDVENVDYAKELEFVKNTLSNAADFTFLFVGNVDIEALKPLLEKYVASLPGNPSNLTKVEKLTDIAIADGKIDDTWKQPMQAPAVIVKNVFTGSQLPYNIENATKVELIGSLLRAKYLETLREEEGGTYTPSAYSYMSPLTNEWVIIYKFQTNNEKAPKLIDRAYDEMIKMFNTGVTAEAFNKVKEAALSQFDNNIATNAYWSEYLSLYLRGYDDITNGRKAIETITLDDINNFMKTLYNGNNRIQITMEGVQE